MTFQIGKHFRQLAVFAMLLHGSLASAQFAAVVSPPRFEITVPAGGRSTQVLSISNMANQAARYRIKTADWTYGADRSIDFIDELKPESCRPWVAIEDHEILAPPGRRVPFRIQVDVPENTPAQECRFALLIEGDEQLIKSPQGPAMPVSGRIGVIFYVSVAGAAPKLSIQGAGTQAAGQSPRLPLVKVINSGNAHGRLAGFLSGKDARGQDLEFTPSTLPILPGETRLVELTATTRRGEAAQIHYPVTVRGSIEWGDQRIPFEHRFD